MLDAADPDPDAAVEELERRARRARERTRPGAGPGGVPRRPSDRRPPLDAYSFRLVATRKLYDQGTLLQASSHLGGLAPGTVARIHPSDADRLGVTAGDRVVLRSARTSLTLPVHPDAGVPRGAVALVLNQLDARVGDLIAVDGPVTELRIETAS